MGFLVTYLKKKNYYINDQNLYTIYSNKLKFIGHFPENLSKFNKKSNPSSINKQQNRAKFIVSQTYKSGENFIIKHIKFHN